MTSRVPVLLSSSSVFPEPTAAAFEMAAAVGYDGVEVMVWTDAVSQDAGALQGLSAHYAMPVLSVHAPFACVNYDGPAQEWAEAIAASCGWPARADIGYPTPGSLGSWLGIDRGLPVITLELPAGAYGAFAREAQSALQTAINRERIR